MSICKPRSWIAPFPRHEDSGLSCITVLVIGLFGFLIAPWLTIIIVIAVLAHLIWNITK